MARNRPFSLDVVVDHDGLGGIHMDRSHKPPWPIGSDGNDRNLDRFKSVTYFLEHRGIPCIARKEYVAWPAFDDPAGPECSISIKGAPAGEMPNSDLSSGTLLKYDESVN